MFPDTTPLPPITPRSPEPPFGRRCTQRLSSELLSWSGTGAVATSKTAADGELIETLDDFHEWLKRFLAQERRDLEARHNVCLSEVRLRLAPLLPEAMQASGLTGSRIATEASSMQREGGMLRSALSRRFTSSPIPERWEEPSNKSANLEPMPELRRAIARFQRPSNSVSAGDVAGNPRANQTESSRKVASVLDALALDAGVVDDACSTVTAKVTAEAEELSSTAPEQPLKARSGTDLVASAVVPSMKVASLVDSAVIGPVLASQQQQQQQQVQHQQQQHQHVKEELPTGSDDLEPGDGPHGTNSASTKHDQEMVCQESEPHGADSRIRAASLIAEELPKSVATPHFCFDLFFNACIILNAIVLAVACQYRGYEHAYDLAYDSTPANQIWPQAPEIFEVVDWIFGIIFCVELAGKIATERMELMKSVWNRFDCILVIMWLVIVLTKNKSIIDPGVVRMMRLLKVLRLVRLARTLGQLQIFGPIHLILKSIQASVFILAWSVMLLFMLTSAIAIVISDCLATYIMDESVDIDKRIEVFEAWGNFARAVTTMYQITLANWAPPCWILTNNVDERWSIFFIIYKCTIGFSVVQVILSVFIQQTFKTAARDEAVMIHEKEAGMKAFLKNIAHLFDVIDVSGDGVVNIDEYNAMIADPRMRSWFSSLELDITDAAQLFDILDDGDGQISKVAFIEGIKCVKGFAKAKELFIVHCDLRRLDHAVARLVEIVEAHCLDWDTDNGVADPPRSALPIVAPRRILRPPASLQAIPQRSRATGSEGFLVPTQNSLSTIHNFRTASPNHSELPLHQAPSHPSQSDLGSLAAAPVDMPATPEASALRQPPPPQEQTAAAAAVLTSPPDPEDDRWAPADVSASIAAPPLEIAEPRLFATTPKLAAQLEILSEAFGSSAAPAGVCAPVAATVPLAAPATAAVLVLRADAATAHTGSIGARAGSVIASAAGGDDVSTVPQHVGTARLDNDRCILAGTAAGATTVSSTMLNKCEPAQVLPRPFSSV
eukprot:NODE_165_length_3481_cov_8.085569.p1 GENE.NODE_165_length_3481_cov_8.085569~~NODE_165_length_3481_cov_8.085569.p1  ORF type:complete len:1009 (-),score=202.32 NODE_165_length_3481_cov_8.085569:398-3424(-)